MIPNELSVGTYMQEHGLLVDVGAVIHSVEDTEDLSKTENPTAAALTVILDTMRHLRDTAQPGLQDFDQERFIDRLPQHTALQTPEGEQSIRAILYTIADISSRQVFGHILGEDHVTPAVVVKRPVDEETMDALDNLYKQSIAEMGMPPLDEEFFKQQTTEEPVDVAQSW